VRLQIFYYENIGDILDVKKSLSFMPNSICIQYGKTENGDYSVYGIN